MLIKVISVIKAISNKNGKCLLKEKKVTPVEDLSQEHGLLNRILLIYEELIYRIDEGMTIDPNIPLMSAQIIRSFIEDYHEKNEETYIFPVVQKCPQFRQLVQILLEQHQIGRVYTDKIIKLSDQLLDYIKEGKRVSKNGISRILDELASYLYKFVHMYRAHESREDTVIFRAFHELTPDKEYMNLGDIMESIEQEKFGEDDYDNILREVEMMEKRLGIHNLSTYS